MVTFLQRIHKMAPHSSPVSVQNLNNVSISSFRIMFNIVIYSTAIYQETIVFDDYSGLRIHIMDVLVLVSVHI